MRHVTAETIRPPVNAAFSSCGNPLAAVGGHGRARPADARGHMRRQRLEAARACAAARERVAAQAPGALLQATEGLAQPAAAGAAAGIGLVAAAARAVVVARVVVVTQAEEPDEPHDQQADIEDAEADHEDPALGGHGADGTSAHPSLKAPPPRAGA